MRILALFAVVALASACASHAYAPAPVPAADAPARDTARPLVGDWAAPREHGVFMRFLADGRVAVALAPGGLAGAKTTGTWTLEGGRLTFTNLTGSCAELAVERVGAYDIVLAADTLRFAKVADACAARGSIDGEVWTRVTAAPR